MYARLVCRRGRQEVFTWMARDTFPKLMLLSKEARLWGLSQAQDSRDRARLQSQEVWGKRACEHRFSALEMRAGRQVASRHARFSRPTLETPPYAWG